MAEEQGEARELAEARGMSVHHNLFELSVHHNLFELVGRRCGVEFALSPERWPIAGYPAWCNCTGVESGMIRLNDVWYSLSIITRLWDAGPII